MPGNIASTVYGQQGNRWLDRDDTTAPKQQKRNVRVVGGPNAGIMWACYSWHRDPVGLPTGDKGGRFPELDPVVDWPAQGGRYVLDVDADLYRWETSPTTERQPA